MIKSINYSNNDFDLFEHRELVLFKINKIMNNKNYTYRESMENIFSSIKYLNTNFLYIVTCNNQKVDIHIGVLKDKNSNIDSSFILKSSFLGNFYGSNLEQLNREDTNNFCSSMNNYKRFGTINGVPSLNKNKKNYELDVDFQGIERLINASFGMKWRIIIVFSPIEYEAIRNIEKDICNYYEQIYKDLKINFQDGESESETTTNGTGTSNSSTKGKNEGWSKSNSKGSSSNNNSSKSSNSSNSEGESGGISSSNTSGTSTNESKAIQKGTSKSNSYERINRNCKKEIDYIDNFLFDRIGKSASKGYFKTNIYIMTYNMEDLIATESLYCSIFHGDSDLYNFLTPYILDPKKEIKIYDNNNVLFFNHLNIKDVNNSILNGIPKNDNSLCSFLTSHELSIIAGIPINEVPNLLKSDYVEFGLNIDKSINTKDEFEIGNLINKEVELKSIPMKLDKKILNKHIFITGVTGSGKTTTCQKILLESKLPFMVIEPSKTEYRELISKTSDDIIIFTIGNELNAPFRFNPFEILEGENIVSHIDMLKASFTNSFDMEASMPQILEEAIYKCYEDYGWRFNTNDNKYTDNPYNENGLYFPIISDLLTNIEIIVDEKGFGERLKNEYIGSLISRFSNLCIGSKGSILNVRRSIDIIELIKRKVIFELEDLKSGDDKSFLMSMLISRISEAIKIQYKKDSNFMHITLIEEAHRLLSKVGPMDSRSKKESVNIFSDLIAEIRKYGESLIIADQIPSKMTSEVLKNTNTKIIHKLFAMDDKEEVGNAMMMNDKQKEYLSNLNAGEAIVFTENLPKPVHVKIKAITNTSSIIKEEKIKNVFDKVKKDFNSILSNCSPYNIGNISYEDLKKLNINELLNEFEELIKPSNDIKLYKEKIQNFVDNINKNNNVNADIKIILNEIAFKYFEKNNFLLNRYKFNKRYNIIEKFIDFIVEKNYNKNDEYFNNIFIDLKDFYN